MPIYKVVGCNVRCNGVRYLRDSVVELDEKIAKLNDHFVPYEPPTPKAPKQSAPKKARPKAEPKPEPATAPAEPSEN